VDRSFWHRRNKTGKKSQLNVEERKHLGLDRAITLKPPFPWATACGMAKISAWEPRIPANYVM